ncbi:MAG: EamA family transporter [Bacteroidetes bacterium]|nr:EamA family transporter [Bacteroidota bacterium]
MIYLVLCILSSTAINLIFKSVSRFNGNTFHIIVINYLVASLLGLSLAGNTISYLFTEPQAWMLLSVVIGTLFILMFHLMSLSVQRAGINPTTIASRLSVIIPISFSILFFNEYVNQLKVWGIVLAVLSVILSVYKKKKHAADKNSILLPLIIFLGTGLIDSLVKYAQDTYLTDELLPSFSTLLFFIAFLIGLSILFFRKNKISTIVSKGNLLLGIALGICNFGSIFFIIKALNKSGYESSSVFGINHIGVVALSVFAALLLFREKVNKINWIGIVLAFFAIILLTINK